MAKTLLALVAALLLSYVVAVSAAKAPHLEGVRYDFGKVAIPIDGSEDVIDDLAQSIANSAQSTLRSISQLRQRLPYGRLETEDDVTYRPAALITYPAPKGIASSDQYSVTVEQRGTVKDSFVYKTEARKPDTNLSADTSWTSFSFSGPVTVAVRKLRGQATGCIVRPKSLNAVTWFEENVCYIQLKEPANFSVEFSPNTRSPIAHPMLVFANPPEVNVPKPDDPNVRYFGPGVHRIGARVPIRSGETIYLAGGAWVEGTFSAGDQEIEDVVIKGRGIISGASFDTGDQDRNKDQPGLIDILSSRNVLVEGITLVDAPRFNVRVLGKYITLRNLKILSWWYSTDGVVAGNAGLVEDNFIKVNDDSIKLHWGDNIVRRNVIWQLENGAPFKMSWNIHEDIANFHVYDNDVIRAEHYWLLPQAIFRSRHAGSGHVRRYLFEDIRVEDANWRLFYIVLENNKWFDPDRGYGRISDVVFRNINAQMSYRNPSVIQGIDAKHMVTNVNFEDVRMAGRCVASAAGQFMIDPNSTDEIRIVKSSLCD